MNLSSLTVTKTKKKSYLPNLNENEIKENEVIKMKITILKRE